MWRLPVERKERGRALDEEIPLDVLLHHLADVLDTGLVVIWAPTGDRGEVDLREDDAQRRRRVANMFGQFLPILRL